MSNNYQIKCAELFVKYGRGICILFSLIGLLGLFADYLLSNNHQIECTLFDDYL